MLNVVMPIAGSGARFRQAGYKLPKPLIPVHGRPMVEVVVQNVRPRAAHRFIFVALQEHLERTDMRTVLQRVAPGSEAVPVTKVTEGAACTVLLAEDFIDGADPLMLVNSDQYVDTDVNGYLAKAGEGAADGLIMTFPASDPKWSYCRLAADGTVREVVEKQVVSNCATVGIYNFRRGSDFVRGARSMIANNRRVNGEFYVAPVFNELIAEGRRIEVYDIGAEGEAMHGMGTPADLEVFLANDACRERINAGR